uniref:Uncharacterized protein n=1 Tax=Anguilla anguilla TaxID=7936 RepID=A0A0E9VUF4_ANGAN
MPCVSSPIGWHSWSSTFWKPQTCAVSGVWVTCLVPRILGCSSGGPCYAFSV